jgi:hypothetical protein
VHEESSNVLLFGDILGAMALFIVAGCKPKHTCVVHRTGAQCAVRDIAYLLLHHRVESEVGQVRQTGYKQRTTVQVTGRAL